MIMIETRIVKVVTIKSGGDVVSLVILQLLR